MQRLHECRSAGPRFVSLRAVCCKFPHTFATHSYMYMYACHCVGWRSAQNLTANLTAKQAPDEILVVIYDPSLASDAIHATRHFEPQTVRTHT